RIKFTLSGGAGVARHPLPLSTGYKHSPATSRAPSMPAARDSKSQAPDSAKQRAPTPAPAPLGPVGGLGAVEWQMALDDPRAARPEGLLQLQRAGGNRAVQRHLAGVQRAPTAGESEAAGPQGGEVQTSLENELARARGGGHA